MWVKSIVLALAVTMGSAFASSTPTPAGCVPGNHVFPDYSKPLPDGHKWRRGDGFAVLADEVGDGVDTWLTSGWPARYAHDHLSAVGNQIDGFLLPGLRGVLDLAEMNKNLFSKDRRGALRDILKQQEFRVLVDYHPHDVMDLITSTYHSSPIIYPDAQGVQSFYGFEQLVWDYEHRVFVHAGSVAKIDGKQATYTVGADGLLKFKGYRELDFSMDLPVAEKITNYARYIPKEPANLAREDRVTPKTLYYSSTWIRGRQATFYKELIRRGIAHSIGVYAVGSDGKLTLASGSVFIFHRGVYWILAAATANKVVQQFPEITLHKMPFSDFPLQVRTSVEALYNGTGHLEEAGSAVLAPLLGVDWIDTSAAYKGFGLYNVGAREIPLADYFERVRTRPATGNFFATAIDPNVGYDLTPLIRKAIEVKDSPQEKKAAAVHGLVKRLFKYQETGALNALASQAASNAGKPGEKAVVNAVRNGMREKVSAILRNIVYARTWDGTIPPQPTEKFDVVGDPKDPATPFYLQLKEEVDVALSAAGIAPLQGEANEIAKSAAGGQ